MDLNYNDEFQIPDCNPNGEFNNQLVVNDNIKIEWDYLQLSHQEITQALENHNGGNTNSNNTNTNNNNDDHNNYNNTTTTNNNNNANGSAATTTTNTTNPSTGNVVNGGIANNNCTNGSVRGIGVGNNGTNGCITGGPPIEISPSVSNQTVQLLRPSFSSEYETDTTDFLGMIDKQDQFGFKLDANFFFDCNHSGIYEGGGGSGGGAGGGSGSGGDQQLQQNQVHNNDNQENNRHIYHNNDIDSNPKHTISTPAFLDHGTPEFLLQNEIQELNNHAHHTTPIHHHHHNNSHHHAQLHHHNHHTHNHSHLSHQSTANPNRFLLHLSLTLQIFHRLLSSSPIQIDFDEFVTSPIYEWPSDETSGPVNLLNNIQLRLVNLEPKSISDAVRKTIKEEFAVQDLFLSGQTPPPPEIPRGVRKKNDKDVEWTPLSVYKAYTNIKSPTNGKEAYNHLVPYSSCIGTLNYRPKDHAAWKRSPNRRR